MRILYLADRLSLYGGADLHFLQVIEWVRSEGHVVTLAVGRVEGEAAAPEGVRLVRLRGLAGAVDSASRLSSLDELLVEADLVHVQNVMNPEVLRRVSQRGRAVATVQDHRFFCPGMGRTLPDDSPCVRPFDRGAECSVCLPDDDYRNRLSSLTSRRRDALSGVRLVVLSSYMARELEMVGLPGAEVIPPWVEVGPERRSAGPAFLVGGRLVRHKEVLEALEAWEDAGGPLHLKVAGRGLLERDFQGRADTLGWLSQRVLETELRQCRALLFPAGWQEPFGILGVQALAQGTPVIAADRGGMGEWNRFGCVRVSSRKEMRDAVRDLAEDPDEALRLGREGRAFVAETFPRERIAARLTTLYDEVASA